MSNKKHLFGIIAVAIIAIVGMIFFYVSLCRGDICPFAVGGIMTFEKCVAEGNPIVETYPRQCESNGQIYKEDIPVVSVNYSSENVGSSAITVDTPQSNERAGNPVTIAGKAHVFENQLHYRILDADRLVLAEGSITASGSTIGEMHPFSAVIDYKNPKTQAGVVEVFDYSAKDGTQIDTVSIPVFFKPLE